MRACYGPGHVPVAERLTLPRRHWRAQRVVARFDRDLRLRKSAESAYWYVLERRIRQQPAVNTALRDLSDMHIQARDGYVHISTVHPAFLWMPHRLVARLREEGIDLWDSGGAGKIADEMAYEEQWARITRRRRRLQLFREIALDSYDPMSRLAGTRVSAPGPLIVAPA